MLGIVLLGPPGVGKGTQAVRLKESMNLLHLSTGDAFREAVRRRSPLGEKVQAVLASGALVADEMVGEVVEQAMGEQLESVAGVLLDGFPRTLAQVEILDRILARTAVRLEHAVLIDAPEKELVRRLTGRRVCAACGAVYHVQAHPPRHEGRCDSCAGNLTQRPDDRAETVLERLRVYREQTNPVVAVYRQRGLLRRIDGVGTPEAVFSRLVAAVRGVAA